MDMLAGACGRYPTWGCVASPAARASGPVPGSDARMPGQAVPASGPAVGLAPGPTAPSRAARGRRPAPPRPAVGPGASPLRRLCAASAGLLATLGLPAAAMRPEDAPRADLNGLGPATVSAVVVGGCAALGLAGLVVGLCISRGLLCGLTTRGLPS